MNAGRLKYQIEEVVADLESCIRNVFAIDLHSALVLLDSAFLI